MKLAVFCYSVMDQSTPAEVSVRFDEVCVYTSTICVYSELTYLHVLFPCNRFSLSIDSSTWAMNDNRAALILFDSTRV